MIVFIFTKTAPPRFSRLKMSGVLPFNVACVDLEEKTLISLSIPSNRTRLVVFMDVDVIGFTQTKQQVTICKNAVHRVGHYPLVLPEFPLSGTSHVVELSTMTDSVIRVKSAIGDLAFRTCEDNVLINVKPRVEITQWKGNLKFQTIDL